MLYLSKYLYLILLLFISIKLDCKYVNNKNKNKNFKILVTSSPKCGTHLCSKHIGLLTNNREIHLEPDVATLDQSSINKLTSNEFLVAHLIFNQTNLKAIENNKNLKIILILRDPRDQIISHAFWIRKYINLPIYTGFKGLSIGDTISRLISDIKNFYSHHLPWRNNYGTHTTIFEKLVGPMGGGAEKEQLIEIVNIASHIGLIINMKKAKEIAKQLFGNSETFREGKIGSWKKYFTQEHKDLFKKTAGLLLIDLGYEKDLNW